MRLIASIIADATNTGPLVVYDKGKSGNAAGTPIGEVGPGQTLRVDVGDGHHFELRAHEVNKTAGKATGAASGSSASTDTGAAGEGSAAAS